ncbi:HflC protein [Oleidesulfovibrio alaskensis G20]|jgi:membrane protease subunit HflC|uniref:Protein HflC n=1 Tax=Oleidesulfovibrio alaskensis (strain ATCC BAA-1058 / DSM 17464 / G20) TaxID=207559 RepID=Q30X55_OLEA2|nr:protease modulator HflC [Oleidesulfovibrio alaskensis]ABB39741.1 HflC protein [Oleidesulfovibrio alaskensis G20]MBG0774697.1 protease modulator HflC [Oleidesulfovibrio alaskensis]MBL3582038.1 protease modulator HflC [Oleidesulfovibrio alaskensis]
MSKKTVPALLAALIVIVAAVQSLYTVHQTEKAIVLQLGEPVGEVMGPGLHVKMPFIQNIIYLDARILEYDANPAEVLTSDKKALLLDNYARWRITDPLLFYRTVRTIRSAQARLDDIVYSQMRVFLGRYPLSEVISSKRSVIMEEVTKRSSELLKDYGMEVVDVRIKRADLPPENQRAIFGRMRAERERQAKQYRSEGQEEATKIRSLADRERAVMLAEARRSAEVIKGDGEAEATRVYAAALQQAPEFYAFKRSLEAYEKSLKGKTRIIMSSDEDFFNYLQ